MSEKKRVFEGTIHSQAKYNKPTRIYIIGQNCNFPKYNTANQFSFSKFLRGLDDKRVKLTLEILEKN